MKSMRKVPDDAVAQEKTLPLENRIIVNIEGKNLAVLDKVSNLPAQTAILTQHAAKLGNYLRLRLKIVFDVHPIFIFFAQVIGWGGDNQVYAAVWKGGEQLFDIARIENNFRARIEMVLNG